MPQAPLPNPLQEIGPRRFSFYPPIRNIEHNEWQYRRASWSEIVVVNTRSGEEAVIPRASLGEISIVDDPVVIVGLRRELEWRAGAICLHRRPVIEFPLPMAVNDGLAYERPNREARPLTVGPRRPAPVVNIRLEHRPAGRKRRKVAVAAILSALTCLIVADIAREAQIRQRTDTTRRMALRFAAADDYAAVVRKLGAPARDRRSGEWRALSYPRRQVTVVLRDSRYAGVLDESGRVLDAADATSLLRSLPSF